MKPHKFAHWHEQHRPWLDHQHEHYHRPHGPIEVAPDSAVMPDYSAQPTMPPMTGAGSHELNFEIQSIDFTWDPMAHTLVFMVALTNGYTVNVAFPISAVSAHFNALLQRMGYQPPPQLNGPIESLDGFFGSISHAFSSVGHGAESAFNHTIESFAKHAVHYVGVGAKDFGKVGAGLARSRTFGAVLGGVAMVFPAVGGPALAAWSAAHTAVTMYDNAKRSQDPGDQAEAAQLQANIGQLQANGSAEAQLTIAGLQSVPAEPQQPDASQAPDDSSGEMTMPTMTVSGSAGGSAEMGFPMFIPAPPPPPPQYNQPYISPPTGYGQQQSVGFHPREAVNNGPFDQSVGFHPREAVANPGNAVWDHQNGRWRHRYDHERVNQAFGTHELPPLTDMAPPPPGYYRDVHGQLRLLSEVQAPYIAPPPPQYHQDVLAPPAPPSPPPPPQAWQDYTQPYVAPPAPPPPPPQAWQDYTQPYVAPPAPPPPAYFAQNFGQPFRPGYYGHPYVAPPQNFVAPINRGYVAPPRQFNAPPAPTRMLAPSAPIRQLAAPAPAVIAPPAAPLKIAAPSGNRPAAPTGNRPAVPNLNAPMPFYRRAQEYRRYHYGERQQETQAQPGHWVWDAYQGRYVWQYWPRAA